MNTDIAEAKWKQLKGHIKESWGKLTDDEIDKIQGRRERWEGIMQEKYGMMKDEASDLFDKFKH